MDWLNAQLKQTSRPYAISRDVKKLEERKPVTNILRSGSFRSRLEDIFRDVSTGRLPNAVKRLQENVSPVSRVENAIRIANQPNNQSQQQSFSHFPKVIPVNDLVGVYRDKYTVGEGYARCKLASLYRVMERRGWTQGIYNHISLRATGEDEHFLLNAFGLHYSEVTASNLVKVDLRGNLIDPGSTQLGINRAGYVLHSAIHEARRDIKCIIHLHTPHGAGISAMSCGLLPLCQEAMIVGGVSYHAYRGIVCDEVEKVELARDLGPENKAMILHNHGLLAMGGTLEEAYNTCVNLMAACETQVMALSAGLCNVMLVGNEVARRVADTVIRGGGGVSRHGRLKVGQLEYEAEMRVLDNLGYNTGYPYSNMELLTPPTEPEEHSGSPVSATGNTIRPSKTTNDDIFNVSKQIRQQLKRVRKERQKNLQGNVPNVVPTENGITTETTGGSSSRPVSLEYIATHSSGTTRPVLNGATILGNPNPTTNLIHPTTELTEGPSSNDQSRNNSESHDTLNNTRSNRRETGNRHSTEHSSVTPINGIDNSDVPVSHQSGDVWSFLDERQSQGPLPLSKPDHPKVRNPHVRKMGSRSHSSHHPLETVSYYQPNSGPVLEKNLKLEEPQGSQQRVRWSIEQEWNGASGDNKLSNNNSPGIQVNKNRHCEFPVHSSHNRDRSSLTNESNPPTNDSRTVLSALKDRVHNEHDRHTMQYEEISSDSNYPQSDTYTPQRHLNDTHTAMPSSLFQDENPFPLVDEKRRKRLLDIQNQDTDGSNSSLLNLNSNPSLTDLRSNNISTTRPFQHNRMPVDNADTSSSDSSGTDLQVLLKVEATAKQVANSTGQSVVKLSHLRSQRSEPTTVNEANADLAADDLFKKRANNDWMETTDEQTLLDNYLPNASTSTVSNRSNGIAVVTARTPLQTATSSAYVYTSPVIDEGLTGLERAISTAKKVAESTEKSVEKLSRSGQAVIQHDTDTEDDSV